MFVGLMRLYIALQAKDDEEGYSFWLATTLDHKGSWVYPEESKAETRGGVRFIPGNRYITVKLLERYPPDSSTCFKLDRG